MLDHHGLEQRSTRRKVYLFKKEYIPSQRTSQIEMYLGLEIVELPYCQGMSAEQHSRALGSIERKLTSLALEEGSARPTHSSTGQDADSTS